MIPKLNLYPAKEANSVTAVKVILLAKAREPNTRQYIYLKVTTSILVSKVSFLYKARYNRLYRSCIALGRYVNRFEIQLQRHIPSFIYNVPYLPNLRRFTLSPVNHNDELQHNYRLFKQVMKHNPAISQVLLDSVTKQHYQDLHRFKKLSFLQVKVGMLDMPAEFKYLQNLIQRNPNGENIKLSLRVKSGLPDCEKIEFETGLSQVKKIEARGLADKFPLLDRYSDKLENLQSLCLGLIVNNYSRGAELVNIGKLTKLKKLALAAKIFSVKSWKPFLDNILLPESLNKLKLHFSSMLPMELSNDDMELNFFQSLASIKDLVYFGLEFKFEIPDYDTKIRDMIVLFLKQVNAPNLEKLKISNKSSKVINDSEILPLALKFQHLKFLDMMIAIKPEPIQVDQKCPSKLQQITVSDKFLVQLNKIFTFEKLENIVVNFDHNAQLQEHLEVFKILRRMSNLRRITLTSDFAGGPDTKPLFKELFCIPTSLKNLRSLATELTKLKIATEFHMKEFKAYLKYMDYCPALEKVFLRFEQFGILIKGCRVRGFIHIPQVNA